MKIHEIVGLKKYEKKIHSKRKFQLHPEIILTNLVFYYLCFLMIYDFHYLCFLTKEDWNLFMNVKSIHVYGVY